MLEQPDLQQCRAGGRTNAGDFCAVDVPGVTAKDTASLLANSKSANSVPMCTVFADLVETRTKALRTKGIGDAVVDAHRCTQRNSLFFVFVRLLDEPSGATVGPDWVATVEGGADTGAEPLWYVIDTIVHRRLDPGGGEHTAAQGRGAGSVGLGDAEAEWQQFWAYYRKKASEPAACSVHLRRPASPTGVGAKTSTLGSPAPRGRAVLRALAAAQGVTPPSTAPHLGAGRVGPRVAAALAGPTAIKSIAEQAQVGMPVAERIMLEHKKFEESLASATDAAGGVAYDSPSESADDEVGSEFMSPRASVGGSVDGAVEAAAWRPRRSSRRRSSTTGKAPHSARLSGGGMSARAMLVTAQEESLLAGRRKTLARPSALPDLRLRSADVVRCFRGFGDYKQRQELLDEAAKDNSILQKRAAGHAYRPGLALNRLPPKPGERTYHPESYALLKAREKDRQIAIEAMREATSRSQQEWSTSMREYVSARQTRQRPGSPELVPQPPRPLTPGRQRPAAPAEFHRPWSREGQAPSSQCPERLDNYLTPIQRFAKVCLCSGLHPQPPSVKFLVTLPPTLNIRGAGYSDEDLLALAAALPFSGGIEVVDFGENSRINDTSACTMLKALAKRHNYDLRGLHMDHCGLGTQTLCLCTKLLRGPFFELQTLNLSGITIAMHEYAELASALEVHPHVRSIQLAKTGLGSFSKDLTAQVIDCLITNPRVTALELGWNSLSSSAFQVLGRGVADHRNLAALGLACTSPCLDPEHGGAPILVLLELLHGDKVLTSLDISNNVLDGSAPLLLEYAVQEHPRLEFVDVSKNPVGPDGMRSLVRLLACPACAALTRIAAGDCEGGPASVGDCGCLLDVDPSGSYVLDMALLVQRNLLKLLLARLAERLPGTPLGTFFRKASLRTNGKEVPFNFDSLRTNWDTGWQVPLTGLLCFELSADQLLLSSEDTGLGCVEVIERIARRTRRTLSVPSKVLAVLTFIKSVADEQLRKVLLDALSRDFLLTPEQVKALCYTKERHPNCGHDPAGACLQLMPCIFEPLHVRWASLNTSTFGDLLRLNRSGRWLLELNLENPTGRYDLALSEPMDRSAAERLLLLNHWQLHVWKASGLNDISQHENGKNLRNEVFCNRAFVWPAEEWHLPNGGAVLSFDYVTLSRPPKGAEPLADAQWQEILKCVKGVVMAETAARKDRASVWMTSQDVLWALRAVSSRLWLQCWQLRELLCLVHDPKLRADALAFFFLRCLDWPVNGKLCRAKFQADSWAKLRQRLGYVNLFPYFQPECMPFSLDLGTHEQRRAMHFLVRLANSEQLRNIKRLRIDKNGTNKFESFTAGIPMSWDQYDAIPARGIVECTYRCSMEHVRLRARRRLAAAMGGWAALPEETKSLVLWWSVLDDIPEEVVRVLVFLVTRWSSLNDAFDACDSNKDGMLNHKDFVKKMQAMGCAAGPQRVRSAGGTRADAVASSASSRSGKGDPGSPLPGQRSGRSTPLAGQRSGKGDTPLSGSETPTPVVSSAEQEEVLTAVYRFLDASNDGDISRREFEILNAVWRELSQSMYEFKNQLLDTFGSLENAWSSTGISDAGSMSYTGFVRLAGETEFIGPLRQMFVYLDQDSDENIRQSDWMQLECMESRANSSGQGA